MKTIALLGACTLGTDALGDLERARTKVPRDDFKGIDRYNIGKQLNRHLVKSHVNHKACSKFSVDELQDLQELLHSHRESVHDEIYQGVSDTRSLRFGSLEEYKTHWEEMNGHAATHSAIAEMQRDGHCLEIVMWWIHHVSDATRKQLAHLTVPLMPTQHWREPTEEEGLSAAAVYQKAYNPSSTCLACHGGGIAWQDDNVEPAPFPRQVNGKDRARRCDEWYGEDEGECNPCEGLAGYYWGDLPDATDPIPCKIIANASDVPEEEWAPRTWPRMFSVEMRGSDRWPRASPTGNASCNYTTDCSPYVKEQEGQPNPPTVYGHWYAGIRGTLYVDHNEGQFGGGLLRHETVYQFPSGEEGRDRARVGRQGDENMHLTEIHVQTPEMAAVADPGVMLNLVHMNWTNLPSGKTTCNEDNLDWRRFPSPPNDKESQLGQAMCVCVPDPAGLPYFENAYENATYKGRVEFIPPWQTTGSYGPPSNKTVIADHWAKWTFHLLVDVETKLPVLFSSPYGGIATYGNWSQPDELWPEELGGGWRNLPDREVCADPTGHTAMCKDYIPEVTTTTTTVAPKHTKDILMGMFAGLLSDTGADDMDACLLDDISVVGNFVGAIEDLKKGKILDVVQDLAAAFGAIQPAVADCGVVKAELQKIMSGVRHVTPAKAKANFKAHETEILEAAAAASKCRDGEDYKGMGTQFGVALRKIIEEDGMIV